VRLYLQEFSGGKPRAITPEGVNGTVLAISPDNQWVAGVGADRKGYLFPVGGGEPKPIPGLGEDDQPIGWGPNNQTLWVYQPGEMPAKIYRLDLSTGKKTVHKQIVPADPAGLSTIGPVLMTPDGKSYVYGFTRTVADLYLVEGLK